MNVLSFLNTLRPAIPFSIEKPCLLASNGEIRRWCQNSAVIMNGERVAWDEEVDFPVFSLVFFPKGNRRTTIV
jgi:hypothetical protein